MKNNLKAWLYLLPAVLFLGVFMVYPLIDVFIYSLEEGYNFASQTYFGVGTYNFSYVLHDPYFLQALKNTFILVIITVPVSTLTGHLVCFCICHHSLPSLLKNWRSYETPIAHFKVQTSFLSLSKNC